MGDPPGEYVMYPGRATPDDFVKAIEHDLGTTVSGGRDVLENKRDCSEHPTMVSHHR